jgi:oligopeptide/dipeptide ABC transporter ATP-binding protein
MASVPILKIKQLQVEFPGDAGVLKAVDGVSLELNHGEILGLVGESGCGKSITAASILRLIPAPGRIVSGEIWWQDRNLLDLPITAMTKLRGKEMGIIFQDPLTSFNPVQKIGRQITEAIQLHLDCKPDAARELVLQALSRVGLPDPARQYEVYPHELSGGMRQRAMIAMALICDPKLLIADEPTTALDVTIQAQILELLRTLQAQNGMSVLLITHNLGIVAETATKVAVMYAGKIVETAGTAEIFKSPLHPYTHGLLDSIPRINRSGSLYAIPGSLPDPFDLPSGCYFAPRCTRAMDICRELIPELKDKSPEHAVACWLYK